MPVGHRVNQSLPTAIYLHLALPTSHYVPAIHYSIQLLRFCLAFGTSYYMGTSIDNGRLRFDSKVAELSAIAPLLVLVASEIGWWPHRYKSIIICFVGKAFTVNYPICTSPQFLRLKFTRMVRVNYLFMRRVLVGPESNSHFYGNDLVEKWNWHKCQLYNGVRPKPCRLYRYKLKIIVSRHGMA